jgi:hypothetical protein
MGRFIRWISINGWIICRRLRHRRRVKRRGRLKYDNDDVISEKRSESDRITYNFDNNLCKEYHC